MMKLYLPILMILLGLCDAGCAYYSFTGATIPSHLNTIAIPLVEDNSISPITNLDDQLTELLVQRFVNQTRLSLEASQPDANVLLTVRIDRYTNQPTSVGGEEQATLNRVSISATVSYFDQVENEEIIQRTFSSFAEYDPLEEGLEGEQTASTAILENIADDIFTAATSNW